MNHAISFYFGYQMPQPPRARMIRDAGFTHTCLWWGLPREERENGPGVIRDAGLIIENIHAPYPGVNEMWSDSRADHDKFLTRHIGWLDDCVRHHVDCMIMHINDGINGPPPNPHGVDALNRLLDAAEARGVTLALENAERQDLLEYLFCNISRPGLRFCCDLAHENVWGNPKYAVLKTWGHLLVQTHISDNFGQKDDHILPGDGAIDWPAVAGAFPKNTYRGNLSLECYSVNKSQPPEQYLALAKKRLEWLDGLIYG